MGRVVEKNNVGATLHHYCGKIISEHFDAISSAVESKCSFDISCKGKGKASAQIMTNLQDLILIGGVLGERWEISFWQRQKCDSRQNRNLIVTTWLLVLAVWESTLVILFAFIFNKQMKRKPDINNIGQSERSIWISQKVVT
jgi:hypothetical protein